MGESGQAVARRAERGRRWVAAPAASPFRRAVTLAVVLALVAGSLGLIDLATRGAIRRTDATVATLAARTRLVRADLVTAESELSSAQGQQSALRVAIHQTDAELASTTTRLSATRYELGQETTQVGLLGTCLNGVEQSLNALSVGDDTDALSALDAVQPSCAQLPAGG